MSIVPTLDRQQSSTSDWTEGEEKGATKHVDHVNIPQTISEQDEGGNVGLAAYELSKQEGEIVSL